MGRNEEANSNAKSANAALNNFKRNKKEFHEFDQSVLKGAQVADAEKRPNIGEYSVRETKVKDHQISFENQLNKVSSSDNIKQ